MGVSKIKIGSMEITNYPFLKKIAQCKKKIILSTGMSTLGEVEKALDILLENGAQDIELMHCTTDYPTDVEDVNLKAMLTLKNAFHLQKHITLDREMKGPDHRASMPPKEFGEYVFHIRNTEKLLGDGRKKPTSKEKVMMQQVRRSILSSQKLKAGTILTEEMLCVKRPGKNQLCGMIYKGMVEWYSKVMMQYGISILIGCRKRNKTFIIRGIIAK